MVENFRIYRCLFKNATFCPKTRYKIKNQNSLENKKSISYKNLPFEAVKKDP